MVGTAYKVTNILLRVAANICAVVFAIGFLYRYDYIKEISAVDNIYGYMPFVLCAIFIGAISAALWLDPCRVNKLLIPTFAVVAAISASLLPTAVIGKWYIGGEYMHGGNDVDISVYAPFFENSLAASLDEKSELVLDDDLPVLDGALALYPVYAAIAKNVYDKTAYENDKDSVMFTNTLEAYDGIIAGKRDMIFVAGASKSQMKKAAELGAELVFTPIGKEAFVFLVGKTNPTDSLTRVEIKNVYSGKTSKWKTLGYAGGGDIIAFQRPEGSGSQTGLQQVMEGTPIMAPRPVPDKSLIGSNSLMRQISVTYNGVQPAIGYSYRFFAETMLPNKDAKIISVDGVYPSPENIRSGAYPFTVDFYAVTNGAPKDNVKKLIDFILGDQGKELIEKTGYVTN